MSKEQERREQEPQKVSLEPLLRGEIQNPFSSYELEVLNLVRDGFVTDQEISEKLQKSEFTIIDRKNQISAKVKEMYAGGGRDVLNKAVAISILGGWIDPVSTDQLKRPLTGDEFGYIYSRSFGESMDKARKNSGLSRQKFNKMRDDLMAELDFHNETQLISWGVSKARTIMLSARGLSSKE